MNENQKTKNYDLEDRTFKFAKNIAQFVNALPKNTSSAEIGKQLIRSAGSVGANYIEANESLGKKDLLMKIRICRKEAKESRYWLRLLNEETLSQEALELTKIFGSILEKLKV